jgi:hypothetical protein
MSPMTLRRRFENVMPAMSTCTTWPAESTDTVVVAAESVPVTVNALAVSEAGSSPHPGK